MHNLVKQKPQELSQEQKDLRTKQWGKEFLIMEKEQNYISKLTFLHERPLLLWVKFH